MLLKFHNRGEGHGSGPINYLLGEDRQREDATLERGDPDQIIDLIDSSPYKKKYTSGVLSFTESDIPPEQKEELMDSFEETLFPGLDKDQYSILWVKHRDKNFEGEKRLELNFVIPNIELRTGKRLQPFYAPADLTRVDAWKNIQNYQYGFSDPSDPGRRQNLTMPNRITKDKEALIHAIDDYINQKIENDEVLDREDVVNTLRELGKDNRFKIERQTKSSISITDPDGKRNIRLKGAVYEQEFRANETDPGRKEERARAYTEAAERRNIENRKKLDCCIKTKREYYQTKFPRIREKDGISNHEKLVRMDSLRIDSDSGIIRSYNNIRGEISRGSGKGEDREKGSQLYGEQDLGPFIHRDRGREVYSSSKRDERGNWMENHRGRAGVERNITERGQINDGTGESLIGDIRRYGQRSAEETIRITESSSELKGESDYYRKKVQRDKRGKSNDEERSWFSSGILMQFIESVKRFKQSIEVKMREISWGRGFGGR